MDETIHIVFTNHFFWSLILGTRTLASSSIILNNNNSSLPSLRPLHKNIINSFRLIERPTTTPTPINALKNSFSLDESLSLMPEATLGLVSVDQLNDYRELVSSLTPNAQRWIAEMGLFLENGKLDQNETSLLKSLVGKNDIGTLAILTNPGIIDGVSQEDLDNFKKFDSDSINELVANDLILLQSQGILSDDAILRLKVLITEAEKGDYQLIKGLLLIHNYGIPEKGRFKYQVPTYNTQMMVLGKLLEMGIPQEYEVTALAASLDYGSLWTISDEEVRAIIPDYAIRMIHHIMETDTLIGKYGATWQAKNMPLEAQIAIVWGAPGNYYSLTELEAKSIKMTIGPNKSWSGFREIFFSNPMTEESFNFIFVELKTLNEMREFVFKNWKLTDIHQVTDKVFRFAMQDHLNYQKVPFIQKIDGRDIYNSYICNMNWEWQTFKNSGNFLGSNGDGYIVEYFYNSINLPGITPSFWLHQSGYFDPNSNLFKASDAEVNGWDKNKLIDTRMGWNKIPFDNFRLLPFPGNFSGRPRLFSPMPADKVWGPGIPAGYIYRADFSREAFPALSNK